MSSVKHYGFSIVVYLPQGTTDSLRVVEKSNWAGLVLMAPASEPEALLARPELGAPGVYLLVGASEPGEMKPLYVGEADDVRKRLKQHLAKADDKWQQIVVLTRKDSTLNKAHIRWLERALIQLALKAKRSTLANANGGFNAPLHEAEVSTMEAYLDDVLTIVPLMGIDAFEVANIAALHGPTEVFSLQGAGGVDALGYEKGPSFVVSSGTTRASEAPSTPAGIVKRRQQLLANGVFDLVDTNSWKLTTPYVFESPSTAASVLLGRSANGLDEWKLPNGQTLKSYRQAKVAENS